MSRTDIAAELSMPWTGWLAIASTVLFQALLFGLILLRPDLDPYWHTVSEWAYGPYGWVLRLAFYAAALGYVALGVSLRSHVPNAVGRVGLAILAICVLGCVGVGTFVTDPMPLRPPLSTTGMLHVISGMSHILLLPCAAIVITTRLARTNPNEATRVRLRWLGLMPLVALIAFIVHQALYVMPQGPDAYGPNVPIGWPPRLLFLTYSIWVVAVACTLPRLLGNGARPQQHQRRS